MADRLLLLTGVSGEIGARLADDLLADGWTVCGVDRRAPSRETSARFHFEPCDLSRSAEVAKTTDSLHERFGAFDAVVNCAGLIANSPLLSFVDGRLVRHDPALWDDVLASCLSSAFYVTSCVVQRMVESGKSGVIVNVSSVCARGNPGQSAYSAAKAGLDGLTAALAKELGPMRVRVVGLAPGYFDTASTRTNVPAAKLKDVRNAVPLKRLGRLDEVSNAVRFLLANEYVNGTVLELDGGLVL